MRSFAFLTYAGITALISTSAAVAQEVPRFTFDVGAGFTRSVGSTAYDLNNGWNIGLGAGYNFSRFLGVKLDAAWNGMDINGATLGNIGAPSGDLHIFSATVDPVVHIPLIHHFDFYVTSGGGVYHLDDQFGSPAAVPIGANSFFGYYPGAAGVFSNYVVNRPGFDVGGGFAFGGALHGRFFAEAKWNHVFLTNNFHVDYVPVTFGFRW